MLIIGVDAGRHVHGPHLPGGRDLEGPQGALNAPQSDGGGARRSSDAGTQTKRVVHGSTVATNAILERMGVKTALVTNAGFTGVIAIGRQNRSRLYDLAYRKEPPIVPEELRFGVPGRMLKSGEELESLDEDAAAGAPTACTGGNRERPDAM